MQQRQTTAIAIGGVFGASLRWAVHTTVDQSDGFPWATLAVNIVGCGLLGVALAEEWVHPRARLLLHDFAGIGFCGGLTTFSTFAVELVELVDEGRTSLGVVYLLASIVTGVAAFVTAGVLLRAARALALPLEEEP